MPSEKITNRTVSKLKPQEKPYEVRDTGLKGLLLRVQPSGVMTYYFEYARGKRLKVGPADALSPERARDIAIEIEHEFRRGEDPIQNRKKIQTGNYLNFLEETYRPLLSASLKNGVSNAKNVEETMNSLKRGFPEFHSLGLDEITPLAIEKWKQRKSQEGLKPSSIKRQLNNLQACLNRAVKWGALSQSPFDRVEKVKIDSSPKVRYLTEQEETKLREQLDVREHRIKTGRASANEWRSERGYSLYNDLSEQEFADYLRPAVLLSLNTGLRRGELLGLKWSDIDFERKNLTVSGEVAKDGETRHIALNEEALQVLKMWKQQPGVKSQWVFHGKDGQPFQNLRKSWVEVLKRADIKDFRWHDLRHTFASKLVMAGVDLNRVRALLGHSDYKMTLRYAHLAPKDMQEAVNKLLPPAKSNAG
ncbi:MAG: tyrosine-type recombinase/integrase [Candidatus Melainabacteria bacterium]|nr:tyrosine-type recombinase/integrase [Candidatus Melainabacteria bacterium]